MSLDSYNNLYCSNNLFVNRNVYCAGGIMTENLSVKGTISGNVSVSNANITNTNITGNAIITGNISANVSTIKTANITTGNINNLSVIGNIFTTGNIDANYIEGEVLTANTILYTNSIGPVILANNIVLNGNIEFEDNLILNGNILSNVTINGNLLVDGTANLNDVTIDGDTIFNGDVISDVLIDGNLSVTGFLDNQVYFSRGQVYLNSANVHYGNSILATLDSGNLINNMPADLNTYGWLTAGNTNSGLFKIPISGYYIWSTSVRFIEGSTQLGFQPIYRTAGNANSNVIIGSDGTYWSMTDVDSVRRRVLTYTDIVYGVKDDYFVPSVWEGSADANIGVIWCISSISLLST